MAKVALGSMRKTPEFSRDEADSQAAGDTGTAEQMQSDFESTTRSAGSIESVKGMFADLRREVNLLEATVLQSLEQQVRRFEDAQIRSDKPFAQTGTAFSEDLRKFVEVYVEDGSRKVKSVLDHLLLNFESLFKPDPPQTWIQREARPEAHGKNLFDTGALSNDIATGLHSHKLKVPPSIKMSFAKTQPIVLKDVNFEALNINKIIFEKAKSKEFHSASKHRPGNDERISHQNDISRGTAAALGSTAREDQSSGSYLKDTMARLFGASHTSMKGLLTTIQRPKSAQKAAQPTTSNFLARTAGVSANPMVKSQHVFAAPLFNDLRAQPVTKKLQLENLNHHKLVRAAPQQGTSRESNAFKRQILEIKQSFNKSMQRRKL